MGSRGIEPPEVQGFWAINYLSDEHAFIPSCDTGYCRSRIGVGSREIMEPRFWAINFTEYKSLTGLWVNLIMWLSE